MTASNSSTPFGALGRLAAAGALVLGLAGAASSEAAAYDQNLADRARDAIERAGRYYAGTLSVGGAYVWRYSPDGQVRKGEGDAGRTLGWVQPPGTPSVGAAFLRLHGITGDPAWRDAAAKTGKALSETQLVSGGWGYSMETDPAKRAAAWCLRSSGPESCAAAKGNKFRNVTMLDDDTTQSALRFLLWLDRTTPGADPAIRDTLVYALDQLVEAQYPNGSWPVTVDRKIDKTAIPPAGAASFPADWSREWVKPAGGPYYVLNDNLIRDMVHVLLLAADQLGAPAYRDAAVRAGEFLLMAQLPAPQRAWAQVYDAAMQPVWGRRFEPPSVVSRESAGAIEALVELHRHTGDKRFLDAAGAAGDWLRSVRLPDGNYARFYELKTSRPLYMNRANEITYDDASLHRGYVFKGPLGVAEALALLEAPDAAAAPFWPSVTDHASTDEVEAILTGAVKAVSPTGQWVSGGWIQSQDFVDAVFALGRYLDRKS